MRSSPEPLGSFLERWNAHDVHGILELYGADAVMTDPTLERPLVGTEALRDYYSAMWGASPAARLECESFVAAARSIVWLWRFSPDGTGDGRHAVGATQFLIDDGAIVADDAIWDPETLKRPQSLRSPP